MIIMLLMSCLIAYSCYITRTASYDQDILLLNKQRQVEIYFQRYLKKTYEDDILLSDVLTINEASIKYTVDDMGDYYLINATFNAYDYHYDLVMEMVLKDGHFKKYDYN